MENQMSKIPRPRPGYPDRQCMIRAAIYMEHRRYTYEEWRTVARLCDASSAIRGYILAYVKDALDMWDGLEPTNGSRNYEIALIAAAHAYAAARQECGSAERAKVLLQPPETWSKQKYAEAQANYCQRTHVVSDTRVTKKLRESLEQETGEFYMEAYKTASGCNIIPFPAAR